MNSLTNFLENLRPGGSSNIPKSKLEQEITHDSDLDSPEPVDAKGIKKTVNTNEIPAIPSKVPRKKIVKQTADVQHESSEFEDITMKDIPIAKESKAATLLEKSSPNILPNLPESPDNDCEEIRKVWKDLNIGKDGYLTVPELEKMCNHLGMTEMDKKDLNRLFLIIDTDKDNKVSLSEFSNGLKTHGELMRASAEVEAKNEIKVRPHNNSLHSPPSSVNPTIIVPNHLFSTLDPNNKGSCESEKIVELWTSGGILNGFEVLKYFNIKSNEIVNLVDLSASLEREMLLTDLDAITLSGLITYQKEVQYCRSLMELMQAAYNGIYSAENRNSEGQDLKSQMVALQEMAKATFNTQRNDYETKINELQLNKKELMERIMKLNTEMSTLGYENSQLKSKILEIQDVNIRQEEELDAVAELHRKMELELNLLRNSTLLFNQTMTKNDRDELYELKRKFEEHFERENNNSLRKISETNGIAKNSMENNGNYKNSDRKLNEYERKLQLKLDEVQYLKKELESSRIFIKERETENNQKIKTLEKNLTIHKQKNEEYKEENERLHFKIQSLESKIVIAINREKAYRMRVDTNDKEKEKMEILEVNIAEMKNKINENTKIYEKKSQNYSKQIFELEKENDQLNKSNQELNNDLESHKQELIQESENLNKKNRLVEQQRNEIKDLISALNSCREEARLNKLLTDKLEVANDRLSKTLKNSIEKMEELSNQNFDGDNKNLINDNIRIRKENMILEEEVSKLNRKFVTVEPYQTKYSETEIKNLQRQIKERQNKIEEFEEILHKKNIDLRSDRSGSAKKIDQLQFQYEEMKKKYQLQLEQADKADSLLTDLYRENSKLVKSLQRLDAEKEEREIKIIQLEEKIETLQNILNRQHN